jgi:hypothetical protein
MYIGKFDADNEFYSYKCKGDSVYIEKILINENDPRDPYKVTNKVMEKRIFDLKILRKRHLFE